MVKAYLDPSVPFPKGHTIENNFDLICKSFMKLVEKLASNSSTYVNTGTSVSGEIDIAETLGMLVVLQQFSSKYLNCIRHSGNKMLEASEKQHRRELLDPSEHLISLLNDLQVYLKQRVQIFQNEQIKWIQSQKGDYKKAGVSPPFTKFIALAYQIQEMLSGQVSSLE